MQYTIRERSSPMSREFQIENQAREVAYRVHGPVIRLRNELRLDDVQGVEQAWIKDLLISDGSKYEIWRSGARDADITRIVDGDLLAGFDIQVASGESLAARGDIAGGNFTIMSQGQLAALVQRRRADELEVRVEHRDEVLLLAAVVAISAMIDSWTRAHTRST
jgi:uncharacterized protein YxjI